MAVLADLDLLNDLHDLCSCRHGGELVNKRSATKSNKFLMIGLLEYAVGFTFSISQARPCSSSARKQRRAINAVHDWGSSNRSTG